MSLCGARHGACVWCLGRVPKHINQWQELEGLLFSPKNSQLVHILSFHSQGVVSLFIFPTGLTALDSQPRGRRYVNNTGHNRNRLYSRAIHSRTSMEMHYVQWFLLKSVYEITVCAKNQILPSYVWADQAMVPGFGVSAECQSIGTSGKKQRACYLAPKTLSWCIF